MGQWKVSSRQVVAFEMLVEEVIPFCRLSPETASGKGRGIAKLHSALHQLDDSTPYLHSEKEINLNNLVPVAQPVTVDRIALRLPETCGGLDPATVLPKDRAVAFQHQDRWIVEPLPLSEDLPRPCHLVAPSEEEAVRELLFSCGYSEPSRESDITRTPDGKLIVGGLFVVEDRPGKYRLIYDGRGPNLCCKRVHWMSLPLGSMFERIYIPLRWHLRGSGTDLDSYFNRLAQHETGSKMMAFGRRFDGSDALHWQCKRGETYRQQVCVVSMGGGNSPDIAQATHLAVLELSGIWESTCLGSALQRSQCTMI